MFATLGNRKYLERNNKKKRDKKNEELAWQARTLRKKGKISATWTRNGLIYVKTHGESDLERNVFVIRNISDLMPFQ